MTNSNQILHGDNTIFNKKIKIFIQDGPRRLPWQKNVTGMLTRDLFAGANLLVLN